MREIFVTFHAGHFGRAFPAREAAERYPGPRGWECALKTIARYAVAQWEDTAVGKPKDGEYVLALRAYTPPFKHQTCFQSLCQRRDGKWYDLLHGCYVDDVKFWHAWPEPPLGESDGVTNRMDEFKEAEEAYRRHEASMSTDKPQRNPAQP